jgi:hypothetical protein
MNTGAWTAIASLAGVVFGGVGSFAVQDSIRRSSERAEARRSAHELATARRAERLTHLIDFLTIAQEGERVAVDRHHHDIADEQWHARARQTVDRLWVIQKTIHMLCAPEVNEAARGLAFALQDVIRDGPKDPGEPRDEKVWEHIRPSRRAFLDVVHHDLA